jgi:hypothetical protein
MGDGGGRPGPAGVVAGYAMNEFRATVRAPDQAALQYFDGFLDRDTRPGAEPVADLTVEPADPPARADHVIDVDGHPVQVADDGDRHVVWTTSGGRFHAWTAARRLLRDLWLVRRQRVSPLGFVHASAVDNGRHLLVFVGDKRAGKTSLMLDAALRHGWRVVGNDCLLVFDAGAGLTACGLPTYAAIRPPVVDRFGPLLRSRIAADPANQASWAHWERTGPRPDGEHKLYLSYAAISRPAFGTVPLAGRRVTVAAVGFGPDTEVRASVRDPIEFLLANRKPVPLMVDAVRERYGPVETDPACLAALAARADLVDYRHGGDCAALLTALDSGADHRRGHLSPA